MITYGFGVFIHIQLTGPIIHYWIPFERQAGTRVLHDDLNITLHNGAVLIPGHIQNGVNMNGNRQYVELGDHQQSCMGNIEYCRHGLTIMMFIKPRDVSQDRYYLSSASYSLYTEGGVLKSDFMTPSKTWTVSTDEFVDRVWQKVDLSWDPRKGLEMFIDGKLVAFDETVDIHPYVRPRDYTVYIGRANADIYASYADTMVDEMDIWYASLDHLIANNIITPSKFELRRHFEYFQIHGGYQTNAVKLFSINAYNVLMYTHDYLNLSCTVKSL